jgi:hypothetical protein
MHVDEVGLVGLDVARHHLGPAVEIGALLHQDLGADAASFILGRDDGRAWARLGVDDLLLAGRGIGDRHGTHGKRGNNGHSHKAHFHPRFEAGNTDSLQAAFALHHNKTPPGLSRSGTSRIVARSWMP